MANTTRLLLLAVAALVLWQVARGARAYAFERQFYLPDPHRVHLPDDASTLGLRDVTFRSRDGARISGWYVPSRNRAAVILAHGSGGDRTDCLPEARTLAGAGFGVLLFDFPGQGESGGRPTWGPAERAALDGAVNMVATQPDVDPMRVGAAGFSAGGYFVAQDAATNTRLRAVVLAGAPTDLAAQTRAEYAPSGFAAQEGALLALRLHGPDPRVMRPLDLVHEIAPRPLLIIAGADDRTVPPAMARQLYEAAREPKTLWVVEGAGHGDYDEKSGGEFGRRLVRFFEEALLGAPAGPETHPGPAVPPLTTTND